MCPSVQSFKNHYVYGCLDCMSLPEPCVSIALRSEGVGSPRTGVQIVTSCKLPGGCWNLGL